MPSMIPACGLAVWLDRVDVAGFDPAGRYLTRISLGCEQGKSLRLGIAESDNRVKDTWWGNPPNGPLVPECSFVFEDIVSDLCRLWQDPVRDLLLEEFMKLATANIPSGAPVLGVFSPQIPRSVRHGVCQWLDQHGYQCIPLTDPWSVLCMDLLTQVPAGDNTNRLTVLVLLQARRQVFGATIECRLQSRSPVCQFNCRLRRLDLDFLDEAVSNGKPGRNARQIVERLFAKGPRPNRIIVLGEEKTWRCLHRRRTALGLPKDCMQIAGWEVLAEAAARMAATSAYGHADSPVIHWRHNHMLALRLADGQKETLVMTDLTEVRQAQVDLKWTKDQGEPVVSLVDLAGAADNDGVPVDRISLAEAVGKQRKSCTLTVGVGVDGKGTLAILDPTGKPSWQSNFLLC